MIKNNRQIKTTDTVFVPIDWIGMDEWDWIGIDGMDWIGIDGLDWDG